MLASDMNGNDRQILHRALGIPTRRLDIPQRILDLYEKALYVRNANSQTGGSLPDGVLMTILMICADEIELPTAKPTKYGHLPTGTKMWFKESAWLVVEVEFVCVKDAVGRTYQVKYAGNLRTVGEAQLFLEDPRQSSKPVPPSQKPVEPTVAPADDPELAAKRLAVLDRIKAQWTVGKPVQACAPGTAAFTGTVCGYDDRGNVKVLHPNGTETPVFCDYLYPCAEPEVVVAASDPIETDDEDEDDAPIGDIESLTTDWPKKKHVEVCIPGSDDWKGVVRAHGTGKMLGKVQVKPDDGSAAYRWVPATHLYAVDSNAIVG